MQALSAAGVSDDTIKAIAARYYGVPLKSPHTVALTRKPSLGPATVGISLPPAKTAHPFDPADSFLAKSSPAPAGCLMPSGSTPAAIFPNVTVKTWNGENDPALSKYYDQGREYRSFTWNEGRIIATMWKNAGGIYASVSVDNLSNGVIDVQPGQFSLQEVANGKVFAARDKQKEAQSARKWSNILAAISVAGGEIANARGTNTTAAVTSSGYTSRVTVHQQGNPLALDQGYARAAAINDRQARSERSAFENYLKSQTVPAGETISGTIIFQRSKAGDYVLRFDRGGDIINVPFHIR